MRRFLFFLSFLVACSVVCAQNNKAAYDFSATKIIGQCIAYPYGQGYDSSGVALIKIKRTKDSLLLHTIYASGIQFDLEEDHSTIFHINRYKNKLVVAYTAIVPLYFYRYSSENELVPMYAAAETTLQNKIKMLGKNEHLLKPVSIFGYPTVR